MTYIGKIKGNLCDKFGNELASTSLQDVLIIPSCPFNLFSVTKLINQGWLLSGDKEAMVLSNGTNKIMFDIKVHSPKGLIYAMYLKRDAELNNVAADDKKLNLTIKQAHEKLGHCSEDLTRQMAKSLGWQIVKGTMMPCESCAAGKAKQKNVPKEKPFEEAKNDVGRYFLDVASVKTKPGQPKVSKPHWRIVVDEKTQLKFSDFF